MITGMPVLYYNSPYQSPLSALTWVVIRYLAKTFHFASRHMASFKKQETMTSRHKRIEEREKRLSMTLSKAVEDAAKKQDESIYARALSWTLDQSQEENELEKVISGIPKFAHSIKVKDPMDVLTKAVKESSLRPSLYRDVTTLLINATIPRFLRGHKELSKDVRNRREVMCLEAIFFIPGGIEQILFRVSENLKDKKINRGFSSVLKNERAYQIAKLSEFWKPREENKGKWTKAWENAIIAARCMAYVIDSRLHAMTRSTPNEENPDIPNEGPCHSTLLQVLNAFLENVALRFIDVEANIEANIFLSTVKIVTEKLQLRSATQELRVEFEGYFTRLRNLETDLTMSLTVQKNAKDLRSVLAGLRNPPTGNGSPPLPMAQTDSLAVMPPISHIQSPPPMASSPPPGDVIAARCMTAVIASRSHAMTRSTPNEIEENSEILNEGLCHSFLLKELNRFLENVALQFIDVETDIFLWTVRILTEKLHLHSATQELRDEFDGHMTSLINLVLRGESPTVQKNAEDLRSVLANLRNPPSGNGRAPPMAQTDSPAAMHPVSPIQVPPPMASSPPPNDAYISMPSYPSTPSGETQPLIPMSPHQAHPGRSIPLLDDHSLP